MDWSRWEPTQETDRIQEMRAPRTLLEKLNRLLDQYLKLLLLQAGEYRFRPPPGLRDLFLLILLALEQCPEDFQWVYSRP